MKKLLFFITACIICVPHILAQQIPAGYVSLYTLDYRENAEVYTCYAGAEKTQPLDVPGAFKSETNELCSVLLGTLWNWSSATMYCDLFCYEEVIINFTFKTEDIGKFFTFRYAFSSNNGSEIQNVDIEIKSENQTYRIDLQNDPNDLDKLRRLGAMRFNTIDEVLEFTVNYVAVKTVPVVGVNIVPEDEGVVNSLPVDFTTTLKAEFDPINATNQNVTWASDSPAIATIDPITGVVTGVGVGTATITVKTEEGDYTANYPVTVISDEISITEISIEKEAILKLGKTKVLNYTISPTTATNKNVIWSSSNEEVATINETGKITPLTEGTTTITITTVDGSFSDECVVTVVPLMPEGYVSLYILDYIYNEGEEEERIESLATTFNFDFPTSERLNIQLLGPGANWNAAINYCDVANYEEVRVDMAFAPEDEGNQFAIRYARFGELFYEIITVPESLTYEFTLDLTPNSEGDNHLSAILLYGEHFSYTLTAPVVSNPVEVDCVVLKVKKETSIETSTLTEDPNKLVDVYNVAGLLVRKNVKLSEATRGLSKGIYIVGNKKVVVAK